MALYRMYRLSAMREEFDAEIRALSQLRHENIVGISDAGGLDDGTPFLVLDFVPGVNLRSALQDGRLAINTFRQVALWRDTDIDAIEPNLETIPDRVRRENWMTDARRLHFEKYHEQLPEYAGRVPWSVNRLR